MRDLVYGILLLGGIMACVCVAAPEPAILPEPGDWTVDVTFEHPQQITLGFDINKQPRRYWYTIVTMTNNEGLDVDFYPKCELMTDTFQIVPAGKGVSPAVFARIKDRHKSQYPFLEPLEKIGNKILEGEDNARDIALIWPDFDVRAKGMKIFVTGLSNETAVIDHPVAKDEAGNPVKVYLRKTLELNYGLRGDTSLRSYMKVDYKDKRWVMR